MANPHVDTIFGRLDLLRHEKTRRFRAGAFTILDTTPDWARTSNLRLRRATLYPIATGALCHQCGIVTDGRGFVKSLGLPFTVAVLQARKPATIVYLRSNLRGTVSAWGAFWTDPLMRAPNSLELRNGPFAKRSSTILTDVVCRSRAITSTRPLQPC